MRKQIYPIKHILIVIILLVGSLVCKPHVAFGLDYYWGNHPDKERLVFEFSGNLPSYQIERSSTKSITLSLPANIWQNETTPPSRAIEGADLLQSVNIQGPNIQINIQNPQFGYIHFELRDQNKLVFDVFRDILGDNWKKGQDAENIAADLEQNPPQGSKQASSPGNNASGVNASREGQKEEPAANEQQASDLDNATQQTNTDSNASSNQGQHTVRGEITAQFPDSKNQSPTRDKPISSDSPENNQIKNSINRSVLSSSKSNRSKHTFLSSINKTTIQPKNDTAGEANQTTTNRTLASKSGNKSGNRSTGTGNDSIQIDRKKLTGKDKLRPGKNASNASMLQAKFDTAKLALSKGKAKIAKRLFEDVIEHPESKRETKEKALYHVADATFQLYGDKPQKHYSKLVSSLKRAINFDPDSPQVPRSNLRLLLTNLRAGNLPEAKGYFNYLLENHPDSKQVPSAHMYLGNYYLKDSEYNKAAEHFQQIIEEHPNYNEIKTAALNLLKTFKEMELYEKGRKIAEYINNRWPKIYLKNPEYLKHAGLVNFKTENFQKAKELYWKYYNMNPKSPDADIILTRIGDAYLQTDHVDQAKKMYQEVAARYPNQDGGLISKMRLAEEGVYDKPKIDRMFSVFNRPYNLKPLKVYKEIVQDHPKNNLAPLAQLKMAMWYLWRDKSQKALSTVMQFENKFPQSALKDRAREVGKKAIQDLVKRAVNEQEFQNAVQLWKKHDYLHKGDQETDPELELAIALSYWKTGNRNKALQIASPYLNRDDFSQHSESALELMLNIYVNNQSWEEILGLSEEVKAEQLSPKTRAQYNYARALAHENLGNYNQSRPIWEQLASNQSLTQEQIGYTYYFLARNAQRRDKRENTYNYAQQSLSTLLNTNPEENKGKISDCYQMLMKVTQNTGRITQALEWAKQYGNFLSEDSENWPEYRYKLANLYQKAGDKKKWKQVLKQLSEKHPRSYYGQMADADLSSSEISKQASSFLD